MEKTVMQRMNLLSVICFALAVLTLYLPTTCLGAEYGINIDVSPNIINIASERGGDIRILTRVRYSSYIANGAGIFVYFNDSESVENVRPTRDSAGNLILRFGINELQAIEDSLIPDADNDVTVVIVMDNGDEYIGEDVAFIVDKKAN